MEIARRNEQRLALMFIDLDGFKDINDSFGHEAGDLVLKKTAFRLMNCVRLSDMVGRIGGTNSPLLWAPSVIMEMPGRWRKRSWKRCGGR